ncbi:MAG: type I 3-dehydroquinate dehydratase [archaeon]
MDYNLCTCLTEKTIDACLDVIKKIDTELIEHRIDFLENIVDLDKIYSSKKEIIATCRNKNCGGFFDGSEEERIKILIWAIEAGAKYVDIEVETQIELKRKVIDFAKENNCKVIVSMHNFKETPNDSVLQKALAQEIEDGADIGKIVTFANEKISYLRVLDLILQAKEADFPLIAFCMGEKGKSSRLTCLALGSPFTFVAYNTASAPGQFTAKEAREILNKK